MSMDIGFLLISRIIR